MSMERRLMAKFDMLVRRAEAQAARSRSRRPQEAADEKDMRRAEQQHRLEEEKSRLGKELEELDRTSIIRKADLQRQIEWHERQIEAAKRKSQEDRGFVTTLEY